MDDTRFKNNIESKLEYLRIILETAMELDKVAGKLPVIIKEAYEEACPLRKLDRGRKPVSPLILQLIKKKRKLRREKGQASAIGDLTLVQSIQKEMNLVGREIKKEQKREEKSRHDQECQRLSY